jgi:alkyl sulfatase BDS1-like metallo-beta-lactamase superfamily hydrolase
MMGGATPILARGKELYEQGKYLYAQEILNKLVYAEPANQEAKDLLADVFEQIGYQQESPSVRNSFLAGALELRSGIPVGASPKSSGPDLIRAMSTDLWLDYLGIRLQTAEAEGLHYVINLVTPDNGEEYVVELSNGALTNIKGFRAKAADLTITINRADLDGVMMGMTTLDQQVEAGKARVEGNHKLFDQLRGMLVTFTPNFEILPGTKAGMTEVPSPQLDQPPPARTDGG